MPEALEDVDDLLEIDEDGDGDGVGGGGGGGARRRGLDASQDRAEGDKPERGSGRKKGRLDESAKGDAEGKESESSEDASAAAEMRYAACRGPRAFLELQLTAFVRRAVVSRRKAITARLMGTMDLNKSAMLEACLAAGRLRR